MSEIWAHRGARREAPENTLPAFELAVAQGADGIELDVQLSADGVVVVMHDESVDRTTDGHGPVVGHTLAQLQRLDASAGMSGFPGVQVPDPRGGPRPARTDGPEAEHRTEELRGGLPGSRGTGAGGRRRPRPRRPGGAVDLQPLLAEEARGPRHHLRARHALHRSALQAVALRLPARGGSHPSAGPLRAGSRLGAARPCSRARRASLGGELRARACAHVPLGRRGSVHRRARRRGRRPRGNASRRAEPEGSAGRPPGGR